MTPTTLSAEALAPGELLRLRGAGGATPLSLIGRLSMAAAVLSLAIAAALSLIVWSVAG